MLKSMTQESIEFNIQSGDYFGTLATVLDLLRQDAQHGYTEKHDATLQRVRDELIYLQQGFRITRRSLEDAPANVPPVQKTP